MTAVVFEASELSCLQLDSNQRRHLYGLTVMNHSICANREGKYVTFRWPYIHVCIIMLGQSHNLKIECRCVAGELELCTWLKMHAYWVFAYLRITSKFTKKKGHDNQKRWIWKRIGNCLATALPLTQDSSNHMKIMWTDFSDQLFLSVWFKSIFTDVFQMVPLSDYCLKLLVPRLNWGYASVLLGLFSRLHIAVRLSSCVHM